MQIISRSEALSKNLNRYFTGAPCKHGHYSERGVKNGSCLECVSIAKRNKTKIKIIQTEGMITKSEALLAGKITYFTGKPCKYGHVSVRYVTTSLCKECCRVNSSKRRKSHPEYMKAYLEKYKTRRNTRPNFDLNHKCLLRMRCMLRRLLRSTNTKKNNNTVIEMGYTPTDLRKHLESLFTEGMTWDNHGEWHIDHIVPVKWWVDNGITDPSQINALINLQPLWAKDNLVKGCNV